jgi:plastocyanin
MGIRRRIAIATFIPAVAGLAWPVVGSPVAVAQQATCTADGTALTIGADDKKFDKVAIYDTAGGNNEQLFKGEVIRGPAKTTYSVPAQAKGVYEFVCDPHADEMRGTFIVG